MISEFFTPVGVDISKEYFDASLLDKVKRYPNTEEGIEQFMNEITGDCWCVMESTGPYCYKLAGILHERRYHVSIVNPLSVKRFAQMNLRRTKTDKADARLIAEYANIADIQDYEPASADMNDIQQLETVLEQLIKQRTALLNQIEALKHMHYPSKDAIKALEKMVAQLDKMIIDIKQKMHKRAESECPQVYTNLKSVKGIGQRTALLLIAITNGFTRFNNAKKLSAYIGVCPRIIQSGSSIKSRGHICKLGLSQVRATLYMCAVSAAKYNNMCKKLYQRLIAKGKPIKVALLAVVNKLIHQVFACVSKNELFNNNVIFRVAN